MVVLNCVKVNLISGEFENKIFSLEFIVLGVAVKTSHSVSDIVLDQIFLPVNILSIVNTDV